MRAHIDERSYPPLSEMSAHCRRDPSRARAPGSSRARPAHIDGHSCPLPRTSTSTTACFMHTGRPLLARARVSTSVSMRARGHRTCSLCAHVDNGYQPHLPAHGYPSSSLCPVGRVSNIFHARARVSGSTCPRTGVHEWAANGRSRPQRRPRADRRAPPTERVPAHGHQPSSMCALAGIEHARCARSRAGGYPRGRRAHSKAGRPQLEPARAPPDVRKSTAATAAPDRLPGTRVSTAP